MRADKFIKKHGPDLVGRWVSHNGEPVKICSVYDGHTSRVYMMDIERSEHITGLTQGDLSFLSDPHHEWALWLNEHMPADNPREWLRMVLDSVPEERRLLTALALSMAHWHREAVPRGGNGRTCALCVFFWGPETRCGECPSYCGYDSKWFTWSGKGEVIAADAVYEELKWLYDEKWRRVYGSQ